VNEKQIKDAIDRCQHAQNLQADEMKRLTTRIEELEKQSAELKGTEHNGN
jgi:polyhydroxyalkanoate synthesis regulator phasin